MASFWGGVGTGGRGATGGDLLKRAGEHGAGGARQAGERSRFGYRLARSEREALD